MTEELEEDLEEDENIEEGEVKSPPFGAVPLLKAAGDGDHREFHFSRT